MVSRILLVSAILAAVVATMVPSAGAFAPNLSTQRASMTAANVFGGGNKKPQQDLSDIEVRDLTRDEMLEINRKNEEVMNMELSMMTGFSLVLSLPILYLCWVAFFSD